MGEQSPTRDSDPPRRCGPWRVGSGPTAQSPGCCSGSSGPTITAATPRPSQAPAEPWIHAMRDNPPRHTSPVEPCHPCFPRALQVDVIYALSQAWCSSQARHTYERTALSPLARLDPSTMPPRAAADLRCSMATTFVSQSPPATPAIRPVPSLAEPPPHALRPARRAAAPHPDTPLLGPYVVRVGL
jgi:hypothetical protein